MTNWSQIDILASVKPEKHEIRKKNNTNVNTKEAFFIGYFFGEDRFAKPFEKIMRNGFLETVEKRCVRAITSPFFRISTCVRRYRQFSPKIRLKSGKI